MKCEKKALVSKEVIIAFLNVIVWIGNLAVAHSVTVRCSFPKSIWWYMFLVLTIPENWKQD